MAAVRAGTAWLGGPAAYFLALALWGTTQHGQARCVLLDTGTKGDNSAWAGPLPPWPAQREQQFTAQDPSRPAQPSLYEQPTVFGQGQWAPADSGGADGQPAAALNRPPGQKAPRSAGPWPAAPRSASPPQPIQSRAQRLAPHSRHSGLGLPLPFGQRRSPGRGVRLPNTVMWGSHGQWAGQVAHVLVGRWNVRGPVRRARFRTSCPGDETRCGQQQGEPSRQRLGSGSGHGAHTFGKARWKGSHTKLRLTTGSDGGRPPPRAQQGLAFARAATYLRGHVLTEKRVRG